MWLTGWRELGPTTLSAVFIPWMVPNAHLVALTAPVE
jgi:hypothetical protein